MVSPVLLAVLSVLSLLTWRFIGRLLSVLLLSVLWGLLEVLRLTVLLLLAILLSILLLLAIWILSIRILPVLITLLRLHWRIPDALKQDKQLWLGDFSITLDVDLGKELPHLCFIESSWFIDKSS